MPGLEFDAATVRRRAVADGLPSGTEPCRKPRDTLKYDEEDLRRLEETGPAATE